MTRKYFIALCVTVLALFATQAFAEYDKDMVVEVMRSNGANFGELKEAAEGGDYFSAAEALMQIAKNIKSLEAVTPTEGSKEDWDRIHGNLIKAAFKGIGACGEEDSEKLKMYIGEIGAFIKEGHGIFRKK